MLLALTLLACDDFERMRRQRRYDLYAASTVFPDGKTMQAPPPGTVPRDAAGGEPTDSTSARAGARLDQMPPVSGELLATGQKRFAIYCAACHGAGGFGGSMVAANMDPPRVPSLRTAAMRALPPEHMFSVISNGKGRMPSYAWALPVRERWAVVAYLRQLHAAPVNDPATLDDSLQALSLARRDAREAPERTADSARRRP